MSASCVSLNSFVPGYLPLILAVRVDIGGETHEDITPQCWRSYIQVLVVIEDVGVVIYI